MPYSGKTMTFATDLVPQEDNIYSLGNDDLRWRIYGNIQPITSKSYPAYTCLGNDANKGVLFFGKINITDYDPWQTPWSIHYRMYVTTSNANMQGWYDCHFSIQGSTVTWYNYNNFYSTSYRPIYHHRLLYPKSGYSQYGGYFGVRVQSANEVTTTARIYKIEVLETKNCTIELLPAIKRFDEVYITTNNIAASTIWNSTDYNGTDVGLQEQGDANSNTYDRTYINNNKKARVAITAGSICVGNSDGYAGIDNGVEFDITYPILYQPNTIAVNGARSDFYLYYPSITSTVNTTGLTHIANGILYMTGTLSGTTFTCNSKILTYTIPTIEDDIIYIPVAINTNATTQSFYFLGGIAHLFWYKDGAFREYNGRSIKSITRSGTTFTATRDDGSTFTFTQQDTAGITSVTIGATSPVQSSTSTTQSGSSASTTISLADAYGDTKNPYGTKAKNLVLAGPTSGSNAAPTFRALVAADIPSLAYVPATSGVNDVNTLVNTGIYNITSGSATNTPKGYGYGQLLVMSYRKHKDNTTTDWASQLYLHNGGGTASGSASAPGNVLYYRTSNSASSNTWFDWQKVVHVDDAYTKVGDTNKPVYIAADGTATAISYTIAKSVPADAVFTDTNKYHKTGSWSGLTYTATAVNSADELKFTVPNKIQTNWELNATSGNSPALLFTRDGSLTDWKILVTSGKLSFQSATDGTTWTERAYFKDNSGDFVATSFTGNGSNLTDLNASNISSGTLNLARLGNQNANYVLAGPTSGNATTPTWRTIVAADLPTATTNALGIMKVGTGLSVSSGTVSVIYGNVANKAVQGNQTIFKLNGGNINSGSNASFYAPITYGTAGYILKANGESEAPSWIQLVPVANGGTGLSTTNPHTVLIGPATGEDNDLGAPTWRAIGTADLPMNHSFLLTGNDAAATSIPSNEDLNKKIYYSSEQPTGSNAKPGMFWFQPASFTMEDLKCLIIGIVATNTTSVTINSDDITTDMVVVKCVLSNPSAQASDLTWTTTGKDPEDPNSRGSIVVNGTINGTTAMTFYLIHAR